MYVIEPVTQPNSEEQLTLYEHREPEVRDELISDN